MSSAGLLLTFPGAAGCALLSQCSSRDVLGQTVAPVVSGASPCISGCVKYRARSVITEPVLADEAGRHLSHGWPPLSAVPGSIRQRCLAHAGPHDHRHHRIAAFPAQGTRFCRPPAPGPSRYARPGAAPSAADSRAGSENLCSARSLLHLSGQIGRDASTAYARKNPDLAGIGDEREPSGVLDACWPPPRTSPRVRRPCAPAPGRLPRRHALGNRMIESRRGRPAPSWPPRPASWRGGPVALQTNTLVEVSASIAVTSSAASRTDTAENGRCRPAGVGHRQVVGRWSWVRRCNAAGNRTLAPGAG